MKKYVFPVIAVCAVLAVLSVSCVSNEPAGKKAAPSDSKVTPAVKGEYVPHLSVKLPSIRIDALSGKDDFVTLPVDEYVSNLKKTWGAYMGEPAPWSEDCTVTVYDESKTKRIDKADAKVKVRGNWTSDYPKKGLRIRFAEKQGMLGLNNDAEFKTWILLSSFKDWSFLRDALGLYLGNMISPYYTSDFRLVDVYINNSYWGVYLLAEGHEVKPGRINISQNEKDNDSNFTGYLLELDEQGKQDENKFNVEYNCVLNDSYGKQVKRFTKNHTIKSEIVSEKQVDFIRNYINKLWKLCYSAAYQEQFYEFNKEKYKLVETDAADCYECVSRVIDIESLVDAYILNEIYCDPDFYLGSFFMDVDFGPDGDGKLRFESPWDFDSAFANKSFCANAQGLYAGANAWEVNHQTRGYGNPWLLVFVNCDWFQDLVRQKWQYINSKNVCGKVVDYIDFVTNNYQEYFEANYKKWDNAGKNFLLGNELCPAASKCKNQKEASDYLRDWIIKRFEALDELWLD